MKQKFSSALSLALIMAMLFTSVGLADNLATDGDGLIPVNEISSLNLGNVCQAGTASSNVYLLIRRTGGGQVYDDGATVALSAATTPSVFNSFSDGSIVLPENWTDLGNNALSSDTARSTITVSAGAAEALGPKTGSIIYSATGGQDGSNSSLTRTATINLGWTVVNCMQNQTINVTTSAPSNAAYGSSFNVAATATSGLPVSITTGGACSGNGSDSASITMTSGTGTCTVTYNQAGSTGYYPAPEVTNSTVAQKADATVIVNGYSDAYDGVAHGATGSATGVGGADLSTFLNLGDSYTNVPGGTANWSFSGGDNYLSENGSVSIDITKASVTAKAGSGSGTYTGSAQTPADCAVSGDYTGNLTCANDPASVGPNAGTYTISPIVSGPDMDNFDIAEVDGSFTINKADAVCNVTGYTGTYDGQPHGATGTCTGVNGEDLSAGLNVGASFTDYPGDVAHWTFSGGTNYEDESGDVNITINKAPVTATAGSGSSTYDGIAKSPSTCVVSGDYTGDLACANDQASVGPDAGSYTIQPVVSGTGLSNFEITLANGSFEIAKAPVRATAGSGSGTYTGFAQTPSACVVSGVFTGDLTCANNPSSVGPNAGTYAIAPVVSGTGLDNYEITPANGSYTINKADTTIAISGFTGYYDGASHCATGSATGGLGEDLSAGLDLGLCFTDVPGGTANWSFSGGTNYNDDDGSVAISILAWTFRGFYQPVDMDKLNTVKGGSTVPLKFEVFAGSTELTSTSVVKSFVQTRVSCDTNAVIDEIEVTTTGGTSLRYDVTGDQFVQNWQTPRQTGACYLVTMTTQDGSTLQARFKLK
jgi:hypothetical protein